jgi:hypothetical protein
MLLALDRVTRLGKISQFLLLIKDKIWFLLCILSVQKDFVKDVLDLKLSFNEDIFGIFLFWQLFWLLFQKFGQNFPNLLVTLALDYKCLSVIFFCC